jgi:hypothetical protein
MAFERGGSAAGTKSGAASCSQELAGGRQMHGALLCLFLQGGYHLGMADEADDTAPTSNTRTSLFFDLKEYDFLRADIQTLEAEIRTMERYALIAVSAIWTWFATEMPGRFEVAAYLSIALGILGALRSIALGSHMGAKAAYSSYVEEIASDERLGGWERYFYAVTHRLQPIPAVKLSERPRTTLRPGLVTPTAVLFWLTLIVAPYPFSCFLSSRVTTTDKSTSKTVEVRCVTSSSVVPDAQSATKTGSRTGQQ